jgi:Ca2+-binding EF-hand superfamily protein
MTNQPVRTQKKTEMIEVRVSHETKRDFLAACERAERTASDVIRESIDNYIRHDGKPQQAEAPATKRALLFAIPTPIRRKRYLAAGAAVAGLALAVALPSAAAPGLDATFKALDANGDSVLTLEEFSAQPAKGVSQMTLRKAEGGASPNAVAVDPASAAIYIVLPDADGKAAELRRAVRFQAFGPVFSATMQDRRRTDFASYDANTDGKVDLEEYRARFSRTLGNGFTQLDKDKSGDLDAAEYQTLSTKLVSYPVDAITALGVTAGYGAIMTPETVDADFKARDTNKDGKLSLKEYLPPA